MPLDDGAALKELALNSTVDEFMQPHFAGVDEVRVWTALSVTALNAVAGHGRAILQKAPSKVQKRALAEKGPGCYARWRQEDARAPCGADALAG